MAVLVNNIKLTPDEEEGLILEKTLQKLKKQEKDLLSFRIARQSIDARKKQVHLVYRVLLELKTETHLPDSPDIIKVAQEPIEAPLTSRLTSRPVVVGTGPCGLFCALTLARAGAAPLILERGADVDTRTERVEKYWQTGILDPNSNVQFGEGGAGTFSDGKLTTRVGDHRITAVLKDFHRFGAHEDILYKAKPHIGTDVLKNVVKNMRAELINLGAEIQFETALTDVVIQNGRLTAIVTSNGETIPCEHLILAIGHSARDTYEMLLSRGVAMTQKPFSVGLRIEHLQSEIDKAMYGDYAGHPQLGPAEYQLSHRSGEDACYSFCMCPGGLVVAAASEPETIVTNGMSRRARNEKNANSAICVNVDRRYFDSDHPLAGVKFQQAIERKAFCLTGGYAPMQAVGDFLKIAQPQDGRMIPSYTGKTKEADLKTLFPEHLNLVLQQGLVHFNKKIHGFTAPDALLTGPETRTSAPLRMLRNEETECTSIAGLYPAGEGAGYAGGIMSAAIDGIRVAEALLKKES